MATSTGVDHAGALAEFVRSRTDNGMDVALKLLNIVHTGQGIELAPALAALLQTAMGPEGPGERAEREKAHVAMQAKGLKNL